MARNKVKLAWIANNATRRATFRRRRKGLLKKVEELSILCGVEACAIVYGQNKCMPEVWPSLPEVARIVGQFKIMPEMEQVRKMVNQEEFLRQQTMKLLEQLRKQERENKEMEMKLLILEGLKGQSFDKLGIEDATCLSLMLQRNLKEAYDKMDDQIKNKMAVNQATGGPSALPPQVMAPPPPALTPVATEKTPPTTATEQAMDVLEQLQTWFTDMGPWWEDFYQPPPPAPVDHTSPWPDPSFPFN